MSDGSRIEWTNATWNPTRGCRVVSPGCTNCYAMKQAHRFSGSGGAYEGLTRLTRGGPVWAGEVRTVEELLEEPLRWRKPRRIFVDSMSDLFHDDVSDEFIERVFAVMACAPQHTFQLLTKRAQRMWEFMNGQGDDDEARLELIRAHAFVSGYAAEPEKIRWPLPNLWLGVSVEDQRRADERVPALLDTPAAVRWVSCEPLLGPVRLDRLTLVPQTGRIGKPNGRGGVHRAGVHLNALTGRFVESGVDFGARLGWAVVGGESGPGARPMHPDWALSLRDQCATAGVAFHFKQWGEWRPPRDDDGPFTTARGIAGKPPAYLVDREGLCHCFYESAGRDPVPMIRVGKKRAGRELDGRTHDEFPGMPGGAVTGRACRPSALPSSPPEAKETQS